jgi:hypothetical protein
MGDLFLYLQILVDCHHCRSLLRLQALLDHLNLAAKNDAVSQIDGNIPVLWIAVC